MIEDPALRPGGGRTVYVVQSTKDDRNVRTLWQVTDGGKERQLTRGDADSAPRWSPDGTAIAFLRNDAKQGGPAQLWLLPADGGEPERLTDLEFGAGAPVW